MSSPGPSIFDGEVTPKASRSISNPAFLMSPFLHDHSRESTPPPPPMESPLPRTPRPQRFLNPPHTPLPKFSTSFGDDTVNEDTDPTMLHAGMAIARPASACSTYSCSSDSSIDSISTYATADGSCTSIEDEGVDNGSYATPKGKAPRLDDDAYVMSAMAERQIPPVGKGKGKEKVTRKRKTQWTEAMDAHLWGTYVLYQQNPKMTPFFVLPGQVPPLGVCYRVAREAKKTWRDSRQYTPIASRTRTKRAAEPSNNRGDALRKTSPYTWPASESSTRRRLRELSRANYGPSHNPYHYHQQQRSRATEPNPRSSTISPSPIKTTVAAQNAFSTTRSMALSLTTATASSMRPTGALASLTSGRDILPTHSPFQFGNIEERMASAPSVEAGVLSTGSLSLGIELSRAFTTPKHGHHRHLSLDSNPPSLLPPLELQTSRSPYGTWPRRPKRAEDEEAEAATPPPPRTRPRRGTLGDLFGDDTAVPSASAPAKTRTRARGYTISAGTNPLGTRKRTKPPSAPLLTVTGPVSYEGDGSSPIAMRESSSRFEDSPAPRRLGSPFMGRESAL